MQHSAAYDGAMMPMVAHGPCEVVEPQAVASAAMAAPRGLFVCAGEDCSVWMPPEAVAASTVLQMLMADELADGSAGEVEPEDLPMRLSVPIPPYADGVTMRSGLQQMAAAFQQGFPLALRWQCGDVKGLQAAVSLLNCAHFLDAQLVAVEACDEVARSLAAGGDAAKVWEYFGAGLGARVEGTARLSDEADELAEQVPILGDRGRALLEIWGDGRSPLAGLPAPCISDILSRAGAIVRRDAGVRELLHLAENRSAISAAAADVPNSPLGKALAGPTAEAAAEAAGVGVSNAVDIICARWERYYGCQPLVAALSVLAMSELRPPELRVRCIHTIEQVASPGDACAICALCEILAASRDSGAALCERGAEPSASRGHIGGAGAESPIAAAFRRIKLDAAWQVRAAACAALVKVACASNAEVVQALCAAVDHGYFEVRAAATRALGRVAQAGDCRASESLLAALSDDDWRVREASIEALVKLSSGILPAAGRPGPGCDPPLAAAELVPVVCDRLGHKAADVRQAARAALQGMASQCDRFLIARLVVLGVSHAAPGRRVPLLRRPLPEVRQAAVEVLGDALAVLAGGVQHGYALAACSPDQNATLPRVGDPFVVGLVSVVRALSDRQAIVRKAGASALGGFGSGREFPPALGSQIVSHALDVVRAGLKSAPATAMDEVLEVFRVNAVRGDQAVVTLVQEVLLRCDTTPGTRQAAARTLSGLASRGDQVAMDALLQAASEAGDLVVSEEAFQGIEAISLGEGHEVKALVAVAEAEAVAVAVRRRALRSLARLAQLGDKAALSCAIATLQGSVSALRVEALGVVVRVAEPGDTAAKALVAAHLGDSDQEVCRRAMDACEVVAERGDIAMIDSLVRHIVCGESCIHQMAIRTLQRVSVRGDPVVLSRLLPWTEHGHWPQRLQAMEALGALAPRGHEAALGAAMRCISDADQLCRQMACEALGQIAMPGDDSVVSALVALLDDQSWLVRDAAGLSLAKVVNSSHVPMLEHVIGKVIEDTRSVVEEALAAARVTKCTQS